MLLTDVDREFFVAALAADWAALPAGQLRGELLLLLEAVDRRRADGDGLPDEFFLELVTDFKQRLAVGRWPGRTGRTDHVCYLAHALTAYQCGKVEYNLSERELAERAGIGQNTAHKANGRLREATLVERVKQTDGVRYGALWRLQSDKVESYPHIPVREGMIQLCHSDGTGDALPPSDHDAFRYRGLGKSAAELWALLKNAPMTAGELAERSGRTVRTVYRNLAKLARIVDAHTGEVFRLVERGDGDTWRALDADFDAIAQAVGTAGVGERQRAKHERERAGWRLAIDRQAVGDAPKKTR